MTNSVCRSCGAQLEHVFVDLGMSPLANSYVRAEQLNQMEPFYPLKAFVCGKCFLVQLEEFEKAENIFSDYAYFSSYSDSWLKHAEHYTQMMVQRFGLTGDNQVVELASNDGYLLQYFQHQGVPVLGVEPAGNVAKVAVEKGIPTMVRFFGVATGKEMAAQGIQADVVVGNNVVAHVPDLNDFIGGIRHILKPNGVITMEFAYLHQLIQQNQFDTIYHEHFQYYTLISAIAVFARQGFKIFDVEELPTHGGSLRIFAAFEESEHVIGERVRALVAKEKQAGYDCIDTYLHFAPQVEKTKRSLLKFLIQAREEGRRVVGYGAPAKGNTLLNYCGVRSDFIDYTVDRSPHKQGFFLPGTHIPILSPDKIMETKPDYVLILPWNIKDEVIEQMSFIRTWGGSFVVPIPEVQVGL